MKFVLFAMLFFLLSCKSIQNHQILLSPQEVEVLTQASNHVQKREFKKAAKLYDMLLKTARDERIKSIILFNLGSVYRDLGRCETSIYRYRELLEYVFDQKQFKARTLLEISHSYECLGKLKLSLFSLKDIGSIRQSLSLPVNLAIYPARLGIAYAYSGKSLRADQYKSLALNGILQLKTRYSSEEKLNEELSSFFYLMGRSHIKTKHLDKKAFLRAFPYHHLYLWQALFIQDTVWSSLAQKELTLLYKKLKLAVKSKKIPSIYKENIKQNFKDIENLLKKEKNSKLKEFFDKNKNL